MSKKIKNLLILSTLAFGLITPRIFDLSNINETKAVSRDKSEPEHELFETINQSWFTLSADAYSDEVGPGLEGKGKADLSLRLSPVLSDYKTINADSLKAFMNGAVDAVKYILKTQVKFIEPVDKPDTRPVNDDISSEINDRGTIFKELVTAAITGENIENFDSEFESYQEAMAGVDTYKNSTGSFLKAVLSYMAAKGINDTSVETQLSDIKTILGITTNNDDEITNVDMTSDAPEALLGIYNKNDDSDLAANKEEVKKDIAVVYETAKKIIDEEIPESMVIAEIFLLLQDTEIPMPTMFEIIGSGSEEKGAEIVKNAIIDVFENPKIEPEFIHNALESFDTRTILDLMGGNDDFEGITFYKEDIKDVINSITKQDPERLYAIARGLSSTAMDNIRIILGMANNNGNRPSKSKVTRGLDDGGGIDFGQFADFGQELVTAVLNNMSLLDLVDACEALWVDDSLLYSYNYVPSSSESMIEGRRLYLREVIDFINNKLPSMEEIKARPDAEHHQKFHIEVKTPLNEQRIWCDFDFGFQNKDCEFIRSLASYLDDTFDLEVSFEEGKNERGETDYSKNTLNVNLDIRTPEWFSGIYKMLCSAFGEDFIKNDNRLQEKLFTNVYSTIGEFKDYVRNLTLESIMADLKDIDYEVGLNTLLYEEKFNEIFPSSGVSQDDINDFIENLAFLANKGESLSFESLSNQLEDILGEGMGSKINDEDFKNLVNDLHNLFVEINGQNISLEMLRKIENEEVYSFIDYLSGKEDTVLRTVQIISKLLDALPDTIDGTTSLDDMTWMDFYKGISRTSKNARFEFNFENYEIEWDKILDILPLGKKIYSLLDTMVFEEDKPVLGNTTCSIESKDVYKVTYKFNEAGEEKTIVGMLPSNSPVINFGPEYIDGEKVLFWVNEKDGKKVELMPAKDTVLTPMFTFTVNIGNDIVVDYDPSSSITLVANVSTKTFSFTYQWQKLVENNYGEYEFVDLPGKTGARLKLQNVSDSGVYRCVVTGDKTIVVASNEVNVEIRPLVVDISNVEWDYEEPFLTDYGAIENPPKVVSLTNLPEGLNEIYKINYSGNSYIAAGQYIALATITLIDDDNYVLVGNQPEALHWEIIQKPIILQNNFESEESDKSGDSLAYLYIESGAVAGLLLHVSANSDAFNKIDIDYKTILGTENGEIKDGYHLDFDDIIIGETKTTLLIPEDLREAEYKLVALDENGKVVAVDYVTSTDGKYIIINGNYYADYAFIGIAEHSLLFKDNAFVSVFLVIFGLANLLVVAFLLSLNRKLKEKKQKDKPKDQKVEEPEEMEELIVEIVEPVSVEYVSPEEAENMDSDGAVEISIVNDSSEE